MQGKKKIKKNLFNAFKKIISNNFLIFLNISFFIKIKNNGFNLVNKPLFLNYKKSFFNISF
jgi:hypothetical protein